MGKISKNELNESLKYEIENAGSNIEIVNDFSGGIDKAASAELAKTLNTNQQTTNSQLAQHVNETNYYQLANITRDLTITGVQTISGLPFVPEMLIVEGAVNNTKKMFQGKQVGTTKFVVYSAGDTGNYLRTNANAIAIADTTANITNGDITINGDNTLSINWTKIGTGATGTLLMTLVAVKHGGV